MARVKKQTHLESPEQVAHQMEVRRTQTLVRERVYPALVGATTSVDESQMLTQAITSLIMEEAMGVLRQRKIKDIRETLVQKLCEEGRVKEVNALLETLDEETLFSARSILEGLKSVVQQLINDDMKSRTLNSFDIDWNRMMKL